MILKNLIKINIKILNGNFFIFFCIFL